MGKFLLASALALLATPTCILAQQYANNTYDYIVVGSGPGGGPLAANLAKAGYQTLLIEAGDDQGEDLKQKVAAFSSEAYNDPLARWDFFVKQHSDDAINDKYTHLVWRTTTGEFYVGLSPPAGATKLGVYYPRAGTLGGCSTHNAGLAALPQNSDWDEIANITGDSSWIHHNMRKYLVQLENNTYVPKGTPGHGFDGFLQISLNTNENLENQTQGVEVLKAASQILGQDPNKFWDYMQTDLNNNDHDRDSQVGVFGFPGHRDLMGRRVSARDAVVLVANATNPNGSKKYPLTVSMHSLGTKVIFDKVQKTKAIGMEYLKGQSMYAADPRYNATVKGVTMQAYARKEVIISGGAFNSPQMLMLSGIGPKAQLQKFNISVLVDLPGVGANLQDNTEFGGIATANQSFTHKGLDSTCTYGAVLDFGGDDHCLDEWQYGKGPYAVGPPDSIQFRSSVAYNNERDIFIFALNGLSFQGYWPGTTVNTVPADPPTTFDFSMVKMRPNGKLGTLTLTSANPRDVPDINFRFFEEGGDVDLQALADAVEFARKSFDAVPEPLGPFTEVLPCNGNRDCDVKQVILEQAWSHHATSTCAIGADNDPMAVLDSKFRVRGTTNLRVVDASVFPRTPGGFPVLPTFMLAYKATEEILKDA